MRQSRDKILKQIQHLLHTPDGELLMEELADAWDHPRVFTRDPMELARNAAQRDAYRYMVDLYRGVYTKDEEAE